MDSREIRMAKWNASGILKYLKEIQVFLVGKEIYVCLIEETH